MDHQRFLHCPLPAPSPSSYQFLRTPSDVPLWLLSLGFSTYFGCPLSHPRASESELRKQLHFLLFNPFVYTLCYAIWRHFDTFLFHNVSETRFFLVIRHSKIDHVLELMVFLANLSGFSNSQRFLKADSLCGQIEFCNSSLYDAFKFGERTLKNIIKTHCVRRMAKKLMKPTS